MDFKGFSKQICNSLIGSLHLEVPAHRSSGTTGVLNVADLLGQPLLLVLVVPVIDEDAAGPEPTGAASHPLTLHVLALLAREANTFISL